MPRIKFVGDNGNTEQTEYPTFNEIAVNPSILNFNPEAIDEEGNIAIGSVESTDGSVCCWDITPSHDGYALRIKTIIEGVDDNFEPVYAKDDKTAYCLPIQDMTEEKAAGIKRGIEEYENIPDYVPAVFHSAQEAFESFMELAYATERSEEYYNVRNEALALINGYIDAEGIGFEQFKKAIHAVTKWDKHNGRWYFTPVANAMLCLRYPFLTSWHTSHGIDDFEDEEHNWFEYTRFAEIPDGWAYRFGLELCEDLRNQAWDENPKTWEYRMCEMTLSQTKEKFGTLRTYWSTYGPKSQDVLSIYEEISAITCIKCGRADKTRLTSGWISPYCWDELIKQDEGIRKRTNEFIEARLNKNDRDWEKRVAIDKYFKLSAVIDTTSPLTKSKSVEKMFTEWNHMSWGKDGQKIVNHAIGFLDGTPAPNGEPIWARTVLQGVLEDIQKMEVWIDNGYADSEDGEYSIKSLVEEYDLDMPDWWAGWKEPVEMNELL